MSLHCRVSLEVYRRFARRALDQTPPSKPTELATRVLEEYAAEKLK